MNNGNKGAYVNIDADVFGYIWHGSRGDFSDFKNKLDLYVEGYKNHGISDILYCVMCQNSLFPSKNLDFVADKYNAKTEDGVPVDYTTETHVLATHTAYQQMEDPLGYLFDKTKDAGMNVWLSFRMNDCHGAHSPTFCGRSEQLYYTAKRNGWFVGDDLAGSWFGQCLDYSQKYIRDLMLAYIRETLEKYDAYGIELDFIREIICFDYRKTPNCTEIMTEFIRNVRKITEDCAKLRGHKIKILIRLTRDLENNRIFGFDVAELAREGLVDVIVPTSRWTTTDSDMPISEWKKLLSPYGIELAAGLEFYLENSILVDEDSMRALCAQYLDDGADRIYLYNYYREALLLPDMTEWMRSHPDFVLYGESAIDHATEAERELWLKFNLEKIDHAKAPKWEIASCPSLAKIGTRRHVMTYTEPSLIPKGGKDYRPLPVEISGEATLEKLTGYLDGKKATLFLGFSEYSENTTVTVDGTPATLLGETTDAYYQHPVEEASDSARFAGCKFLAYSFTPNAETLRRITVSSPKSKLVYLEIKVEAEN